MKAWDSHLYETIGEIKAKLHIGDSIDALFGSCWFSTFELANGYCRVEVREEDCLFVRLCIYLITVCVCVCVYQCVSE